VPGTISFKRLGSLRIFKNILFSKDKLNQSKMTVQDLLKNLIQLNAIYLKGYSTFLEIGSFYNSPRVKQLIFTVFESIQTIFLYLEEYQ